MINEFQKLVVTRENLDILSSEMDLQLSYVLKHGNKFCNVDLLRELIHKLQKENTVFLRTNLTESEFVSEVLSKWWEGRDPESYDGIEINELLEEVIKIAFATRQV